ncbi:ribosome maturation factor RimP [Lentibacillus amyloliquefaciens]|uniref:Ribosome maturation factor RimP n=1 Tax=Lentibacillus amyloliquefaciens TaxID=1472767 RepID=A0A0U3NL03_9BACI|nr:ribosome maturation factor RimP [Lentibacillus amyloliquefaciens]ALX47467.1 ribosome maturation factor RimP [Lentibacillus amyloliquefaciens]
MLSEIVKTTKELVEPVLQEKGLELVDVEYVKEGKNWFLRVYIDKENGVDIDECGVVSEQLGEKLDEKDLIKGMYFLEVSSPGVERPLKSKEDFEKNVGSNVYVKLYEPINGEKEYEGLLDTFSDETAVINYRIKTREKQVEIPYKKIAKARLSVSL